MQKKGLFHKLKEMFFGTGNEAEFEEIEDLLVESDLGYKTAVKVTEALRAEAKKGRPQDPRGTPDRARRTSCGPCSSSRNSLGRSCV